MPAAAVIPAPIAYIEVVAVKKLVVGFRDMLDRPPLWCVRYGLSFCPRKIPVLRAGIGLGPITLRKLECSKQAFALNTLAWNNEIGLWSYFVGF